MNVHLFKLSFVRSHTLLNQCDKVRLSNSTERGEVRNNSIATRSDLADEVSILQFVVIFQMSFKQLVENTVKFDFTLFVHESIFKDSRRFVDKDLYQGLSILDIVP